MLKVILLQDLQLAYEVLEIRLNALHLRVHVMVDRFVPFQVRFEFLQRIVGCDRVEVVA